MRAVCTIRRIPSPLAALSVVVDASVPAAGSAAGAGAEHAATTARRLTMNNTFKNLSFIADT
jgi:hypothetical protein